MKADEFLHEPIEYAKEWEGEEEVKLFEKYNLMTANTLLIQLQDWIDHPKRKDQIVHIRIIIELIAWKLSVFSHDQFRYFVDMINEKFELMKKEINRINRYQDHRHRTILGYSEKPVY